MVAKDPLLKAFRSMFDAEFDYVCQALRRFGVSERDIDDAAQELFILVLKRFAEYDSSKPARPWLVSFAFHVASNYRRLARHRHEVMAPDESEPFLAGSLDPSPRHEARSVLLRALDGLPFVKRDVFVMHDIEGLEAQEIARILGIPTNTVYSRLRHAREYLEHKTRILEGGEP